MPRVRIRLFQELQLAAGVSETEVEAPSIASALQALCNKYGEKLEDLLFDDRGRLRSYFQVYLNNKQVPNPLTSPSTLRENDLLLLIPPIGGGRWEDDS